MLLDGNQKIRPKLDQLGTIYNKCHTKLDVFWPPPTSVALGHKKGDPYMKMTSQIDTPLRDKKGVIWCKYW